LASPQGSSLLNEYLSRVALQPREAIKLYGTGKILVGRSTLHVFFAFSNARFFAWNYSTYEPIVNWPLSSIASVILEENFLVDGEFRPIIKLVYSNSAYLLDVIRNSLGKTTQELVQVIQAIKVGSAIRQRTVKDFALLKSLVEKEGPLFLKVLKCPNCGGSLTMPKEGVVTRCQYCGGNIYVRDLLLELIQPL
jgi:hypothetical protein